MEGFRGIGCEIDDRITDDVPASHKLLGPGILVSGAVKVGKPRVVFVSVPIDARATVVFELGPTDDGKLVVVAGPARDGHPTTDEHAWKSSGGTLQIDPSDERYLPGGFYASVIVSGNGDRNGDRNGRSRLNSDLQVRSQIAARSLDSSMESSFHVLDEPTPVPNPTTACETSDCVK